MRGAIKVFLLFVIFLSLILTLNLSVNAALPCLPEYEMRNMSDFVSGTVIEVNRLGEDDTYVYLNAVILIDELVLRDPARNDLKEIRDSGVIEIKFRYALVVIDGQLDAEYREGESVNVYFEEITDSLYPHQFFGETYFTTFRGNCGKNREIINNPGGFHSFPSTYLSWVLFFLGLSGILGLIGLLVVLGWYVNKKIKKSKSFSYTKLGLIVLLSFVGLFLFGLISILTSSISLIFFLFFIAFIVFLYYLIKDYSNTKLLIVIGIFVLYLVIMLIPFPECDSWDPFQSTECMCIGFEKEFLINDGSHSECIGIPTNYQTQIYEREIYQQRPNSNNTDIK